MRHKTLIQLSQIQLTRTMTFVCSLLIVILVTGCPNTMPDDTDPPPVQTVDTDGDGVNDADDQCPNSPAGSGVDEDGCPCVGCLTTGPDADGDGVFDADDRCPNTPADATVDEDGCEVTEPDDEDSDGDGVIDANDRCADTPAGTPVDRFGCPDSSPPTGGGPVCGNSIVETGEDCDDGGESADCNANCTVSICNDGILNTQAGEECDPPDGDTCGTSCQLVSTNNFTADNCSDALNIFGQGAFSMNNSSATLDGPSHAECVIVGFAEDQIDRDVWAIWTSSCTATVFVQTCGLTDVDTRIAVYDGSACPATDERLLSCNDDRCDLQSLVSFEAVSGQDYLMRIGTFPGENGGTGSVIIACGVETCPGDGDCLAANGSAGCDDESCCQQVCNVDPYCCDTEWDETCALEAEGLCDGGFDSCVEGAGDCTVEKFSICRGGDNDGGSCSDSSDCPGGGCLLQPGCGDVDCCNAVCREDPFCCIDTWDLFCVEAEPITCFLSCGSESGDCFTVRVAGSDERGCDDVDCCAEVCPRDPFCCQVEWDPTCVDSANEHCTPAP